MTCPNPAAIVAYLQLVLEDGDWANDFLTHCPNQADQLLAIGRLLAQIIGS